MAKTVVVILNWNGGRQTAALLASIRKQAIPIPVWVVDNGSSVDESALFERELPGVRVIRWEQNHGFAGGINRAVRLAMDEGCEFVYEINNDCLVADDCVTPCIVTALSHPHAAIVGSRYRGKGANGQYENWGRHSNPAEAANYRDGYLPDDRIVGCGMLIRLASFSSVGGFDERFFCYGEENDLCWRLGDQGFTVGFCFGSLVLHDHQGSDVGSNAAYYRCRNMHLLRMKHPGRIAFATPTFYAIKLAWRNLWSGNASAAASCMQGLHDGFRGRFCRRRHQASVYSGMILLACATLLLLPAVASIGILARLRSRLRGKERDHDRSKP